MLNLKHSLATDCPEGVSRFREVCYMYFYIKSLFVNESDHLC